ncbi:MAG: Rab family GTPase [Candidatus Heimdallarchaeaceae archaeon]
MSIPSNTQIKILLLGDVAVGKTSLCRRYIHNNFNKFEPMTHGGERQTKQLMINGNTIDLAIWDIAGARRYSEIRTIYYKGVHGMILVFDVTRRNTFETLPDWLEEFLKNNDDGAVVPFVLVGNKIEIRGNYTDSVDAEQAEKYAQLLSEWAGFEVPYIEASAKTGENVDKIFDTLLRVMGII